MYIIATLLLSHSNVICHFTTNFHVTDLSGFCFLFFLLLLIFSVYRDRKSGCHKRREERQDFAGTFDDM